jgi:hypothetical protein
MSLAAVHGYTACTGCGLVPHPPSHPTACCLARRGGGCHLPGGGARGGIDGGGRGGSLARNLGLGGKVVLLVLVPRLLLGLVMVLGPGGGCSCT